MDNPLISIIIPVYNAGEHLKKCLDSVLHQTCRNLEIILIDDGSTDGSGDLCDEYAAKDQRIICLHQVNGGVSKARNQGIKLAKGDYYHFLDSDDYIEEDTYGYLLDLTGVYGCEVINFEYYITCPGKEDIHCLRDDQYGLFQTAQAHRITLTGEPFVWSKLFSRDVIKGKNGSDPVFFREDLSRGEDSLFAHQVIERAKTVWFDKRPLYHYVQSKNSAVRGEFRTSQLSVLKLYDAYQEFYQNKYPELYPVFLKKMAHLLISIYYDLWSDQRDYGREQKKVYKYFTRYGRQKLQGGRLSLKDRLKFSVFSMSPGLFCRLHAIRCLIRFRERV